jgi:ribonuclease-3
VLGLVVGEHLYRRFPRLREGELTAQRASIVSGAGLAAVGARMGLPEAARLGRGEEAAGRHRPGLAASLFEAFIGAVYLDGGLEAARDVIQRAMSRELRALRAVPHKTSKTLLQEWAQAHRLALPVYRTVQMSGPDHRMDFVVEVEVNSHTARGMGTSKREAQEAAAAALLASLTA